MAQFLADAKKKRFEGTYRVIPRVDWVTLLDHEFGVPDWVALYPLNAKNPAIPAGMLSPKMACKLFHDGVFIVKKAEENQKYFQDRMPEIAHRCFKKKQWRKQFFEAARRVCCRIALGHGLATNCLAEDCFVIIVLNMAFELGWRRIDTFLEHLPETEKDRDFDRVARVVTNEEIASLLRGTDPNAAPATSGKGGKAGKTHPTVAAAGKTDVRDVKAWFKMYDAHYEHMYDHIIKIEDHEIEGSDTSSIMSYSTLDGDVGRSRSSTLDSEHDMHEVTDVHHHVKSKLIHKAAEPPHLETLKESGASCDDLQAAVNQLAT